MSPGLCIAERREDCAYPKCECYASLRSSAASERGANWCDQCRVYHDPEVGESCPRVQSAASLKLDRDWWRAQGVEACMDRIQIMGDQIAQLRQAISASCDEDRAEILSRGTAAAHC